MKIFWGISSLHKCNYKDYIDKENITNKLCKFTTLVSESNFFLRSNFPPNSTPVLYSDEQNRENFQKDMDFLPQIEIVNNTQNIQFYSDAFGMRAFYWIQIKDILFFSNSSFFLAKMLGKSPLGINGLFTHLILRGQQNSSSYFEDIALLPPQSILNFGKNGTTILKRTSESAACLNIQDILLKNIPGRVLSDSGVSFSGGIDSSILVSEINKKNKDTTFYSLTNSNNENLKTDLFYADLLAQKQNFFINKVPFELHDDIFFYDMPVLDHDLYGQYCLQNAMLNDDKKYMISGSGADELFGGYDRIFYFAHQLGITNTEHSLDYILERYSYTSFELLQKIDNVLFHDIYDEIKEYYLKVTSEFHNPVSKLHCWFLKHHLPWILKMAPEDIICIYPFLQGEFLAFCLKEDYDSLFPYTACNQNDPSYNFKVKSILKKQYSQSLPFEILNRPKLPFSVQENEIDRWYEAQYLIYKPDLLISQNEFLDIMSDVYGKQSKLLYLSYILWRQRVL